MPRLSWLLIVLNVSTVHGVEEPLESAENDTGTWSLLVEECPCTKNLLYRIRGLLEEYNASHLLDTMACRDLLSQTLKVASVGLDGTTRLTVAGTWTPLTPGGEFAVRVDRLDLDDSLFLYQKDGPNFAAQLVHSLLVGWLWKNVYFYVDSRYEDGLLSDVRDAGGDGQKPYAVAQLCTVDRVRPRDFVQRLTREEVRHRRSIVVVANATITRRLLRWASRANLFSNSEQWLLLSDGGWTALPYWNLDSQVYLVRHSGRIQDAETLLVEYAKAQPVLAQAGAQSALLDNGTYGRWTEDIPSPAQFLEDALRLEVLELYLTGDGEAEWRNVARWSPSAGLSLSLSRPRFFDYQWRPLRVVTSQSPPYVIIEMDFENGRHSYSGYLVDVLHVVGSVLNFSIEYIPVEFAVSGASANSSWNGIVDLLANKGADVGLVDMAVTPDRLLAVDFAEVALDEQATAGLYRRPGSDGQGMDKFGVYLEPFDLPVWIASIVAVIVLIASLCGSLWITEKLAKPSGVIWENDHLESSRAILLGFQAIAQQGCELSFGNPSSRIVFLVLWLFALIAYSSYSATLMSYLTVNRIYEPFDSLSSLARNRDYRVGFLEGSSDLEMFRDSISRHYHAIWKRVVDQKFSTVVGDFGSGFARAYNEKYVLLAPDRTMQYLTRNTCDLVVSDSMTSSRPVTMTFQKESPHRRIISRVLRMMNDAGILQRLRDKWWGTGLFCHRETQMFTSLSLTNVATGFLLLVGGIVGGTLGLLVEGLTLCCARRVVGKPFPDKSAVRAPATGPRRRRRFFHF